MHCPSILAMLSVAALVAATPYPISSPAAIEVYPSSSAESYPQSSTPPAGYPQQPGNYPQPAPQPGTYPQPAPQPAGYPHHVSPPPVYPQPAPQPAGYPHHVSPPPSYPNHVTPPTYGPKRCTTQNGSGICMPSNECGAVGFVDQSPDCAGMAGTTCCVEHTCEVNYSLSGKCLNTYAGCPGGEFKPHHCPSGANVQCCVKKGTY